MQPALWLVRDTFLGDMLSSREDNKESITDIHLGELLAVNCLPIPETAPGNGLVVSYGSFLFFHVTTYHKVKFAPPEPRQTITTSRWKPIPPGVFRSSTAFSQQKILFPVVPPPSGPIVAMYSPSSTFTSEPFLFTFNSQSTSFAIHSHISFE